MDALLLALVLAFGCASYAWGSWDIVRRGYRPSVFSRAVWLALAGVSFASAVASDAALPAVVLAGVLLAGNLTIFALSAWRGSREFGVLELVCLALIAVSVGAWIAFDSAFVGLVMSLVTHGIGAAPTLVKVWRDARSESAGFWFFFFAASVASAIGSVGDGIEAAVLPLYFVVFDGSMFLLAMPWRHAAAEKSLHTHR